MEEDLNFYSNDYLSILNDYEQLFLFSNDMNETSLKHKRRIKRSISSVTYALDSPTEQVSLTMQKIKSSGTKIETLIEAELLRNNIYYSKPEYLIGHIDGKPDFVLPKYKIAIFCDGDFWHGYNFDKSKIKNNTEFWNAKIERNILRDEEVIFGLKMKDWKVFRFWEHEIKKDAAACVQIIENFILEEEEKKCHKFNFVDLFSGIGGFRIPLEELGGKCLAFSEIDKQATAVYKKNFVGYKDEELELGDITKIGKLPFKSIDLMVGGVPCQAWSVAGKMKGFEDPRGKLWLDTIRVVELNKPKAFIFENVKGLIDPRNKQSLDLIINSFKKLGYIVNKPQLLNSYDFGLPQNRDRVFIVGVHKRFKKFQDSFKYPLPTSKKSNLIDLINGIQDNNDNNKMYFHPKEIHGDKIPLSRNRFQNTNELNDFFIFCDTRNGHTTIHSWDILKTTEREKTICMTILKNRRKKIYGNSDGNPISYLLLKELIKDLKEIELKNLIKKKILRYVVDKGYEFINSKNSSGINGIYRVYLPHSKIFSTLTATGTKDVIAMKSVFGKNPIEYKQNFIKEIIKKRLFKTLSAKEAGRLQGFPDWFAIHEDEKQANKQFGNAVSTSVIFHLAKQVITTKIFNSVL